MDRYTITMLRGTVISLLLSLAVCKAYGQTDKKEYPTPPPMTPEMTEFWTPQPDIVTPAPVNGTGAPSDAVVLLGGGNLSEWRHDNGDAVKWDVANGIMTVKPGSGGIRTVREFGDCQLHMEWRSPSEVKGSSQGRGNSGVFLQGRYEIQILDNYENETYANGQAGSLYKQKAPLVNPIRKPGEWNTYDIIYTAPIFSEDGSIHTHGRITVLFNGVLVQNNTIILGTTEYIGFPKVAPHGKGPLSLQDHGDKVSFRNIWIREL